MKNKRGFTLAEVLVTLAVIGVVAALTIPIIIQNSGEKQATTSVKKALSIMNQVLGMSIAQAGNGGSTVNNSAELKDLFGGYMKVLSYDNDNNSFTTSDGMIFTFYANGTTCGTVGGSDPDLAPCIIEVDINGNSGSNVAANTDNYADLYYFVVKNSTVSPADTDGSFDPVTPGVFRAESGTADDVAIEALIN